MMIEGSADVEMELLGIAHSWTELLVAACFENSPTFHTLSLSFLPHFSAEPPSMHEDSDGDGDGNFVFVCGEVTKLHEDHTGAQ